MKLLKAEIWVDVVDYVGVYQVSNLGNVRRLSLASARVRLIHPRRNYAPRLLTPVINNGYSYVTLTDDNRKSRRGVHAMVLEAFKGKRPRKKYACHKDGNKTDNTLDNLYWGTPKQNQSDRVKHGNHQNGSKNGSSKLSDDDAKVIIRMRKESGTPYCKIAPLFDVSTQTVWNVCNGVTKYKTT